jgi:hypothetical protein
MPPTLVLDRVLDGLKDCTRISSIIDCCMFPGKKVSKFKKNNNLKNNLLKSNIPQSTELGYPRVTTPLFYGHHLARAFLQKASLILVCVQES